MDRDSRLRVSRRAFYLQGGTGISANTCLLCLRLAAILKGHKPRLRDLLITHLALTYIVLLLIVALLVSTDIWVVQDIPSDVKCKILVFLHKVMRGLSLGTTCVLSVLQDLTISASGSFLADFKVKSANPILGACLFLWVLTMAIISDQLLCRVATPSARQPGLLFVNSHCSFLLRYRGVFLFLVMLRDIFFVGLMAVSSGYMATLLHRHQQCFLSLHDFRLSPQTSSEHRATPSDLQLLDCFDTLYCADSALSRLISGMRRNVPMLWSIHNTVTSGYGMLSPLVLLRVDTQILNITGAQ
uniref:putative vomeronasal receptor-like protein 4 n=1 Tax=Ictidomys tridecemlineatus TaxID=43179 RepID=UPI00038BB864|nr:putative vomeronasal receptor-like protein 4 [Ictidomys tridecemlineatus]